eukprot:CAMPEP_0118938570 /NCGR_PEP_ID=MMETSP1169-20130426/26389_1 /TAXON_ID=36882 /ORGANISM="Pyramimonas obovata, Strain CCMP722" /LENGTH=186 /DNA_ID=CAMNT_0006882545 /DNA_START=532 /DNA_END=1089 /DNA_ORIENTATION=-
MPKLSSVASVVATRSSTSSHEQHCQVYTGGSSGGVIITNQAEFDRPSAPEPTDYVEDVCYRRSKPRVKNSYVDCGRTRTTKPPPSSRNHEHQAVDDGGGVQVQHNKLFRHPDGTLQPVPPPPNPYTVASRRAWADLVMYARMTGGDQECTDTGKSLRYGVGVPYSSHAEYLRKLGMEPETNADGTW